MYIVYLFLVILVVSLAVGLWLGWWIFRSRAEALEWELAWAQLESSPETALKTFRKLIKRFDTGKKGQKDNRVGRGHFGEALCLIRLKRFDEAAKAEQEARTSATFTPEDEARCCNAYLYAEPSPLPDGAIDAYARYLVLPEKNRSGETLRRIQTLLQEAIAVPAQPDKDQVTRAYRACQRILKHAPDADWVLYAYGQILNRGGRWKEAVEPLSKAVAADPSKPERHAALGRAYRSAGERRSARASLLEAYRLAPRPEIAADAGTACLDEPDVPFTEAERQAAGCASPVECAIKLLEMATTQRPNNATAWASLGRALVKLGRHADAVGALERALSLNPRVAAVHSQLGYACLALGQRERAAQCAAAALAIDENLVEALQLQGDLAYADRDYATALRHYQRLNATSPSDTVTDRLARCYLEVGQHNQAVRLLQGRSNYDPETRLVLGRGRARLGQWSEALTVLQGHDATRATPEYRYYLGNALAANGKHDEADALLQALQGDPTWGPRARRYLGHVKTLKGDLAGAEQCYASDGATPYDLGRLSLLKNDAPGAARHFQQALSADSKNGKAARLGLALARGRLGDTTLLNELLADEEVGNWAQEPLADAAYRDRRHTDALEAYEKAIRKRSHVSSQILCRLAAGYLQLNRYREALPHLVELSRRFPRAVAIRFNLAVCRHQIARMHFRQGRWELARGEWARCAHLLKPVAAPEAEAIHQCELEAAYRSACGLLLSNPPGDLTRALQLMRTGTQTAAQDPRWWFGAGLAAALTGRHDLAAPFFAEARKLAPDSIGSALGEGLSWQTAERNEQARAPLAVVLKAPPTAQFHDLYTLAARLGLVVSHARDRQWGKAATELEPLLAHPLLRASKRINPSDIAQVMVAYYALGGDKDKAAAVAQQHLKGGQALGSLLIGLVQAESGDYAGAADTLAQAYEQDKNPTVRGILVGCLLAAAAECVLKRDLKNAGPLVKKALGYDAQNADARRLSEALEFGQQFQHLDLAQIDQAVSQCESLLKEDTQSSQLVRTLGTLYHRKALSTERSGRGKDDLWEKCLQFWKKRILDDNAFWTRYQEEYNAGKGRREQVKPDDLTEWKTELPGCFARAHASYAGVALKSSDMTGVQRHLDLVWKWKPDYEPPKDFLLADIGEVDEAKANLLAGLQKKVRNKEVQATLGKLAAVYWANQAGKALTEAAQTFARSIQQANAAVELINRGVPAASGNPAAVVMILRQARDWLQEAKNLAQTASNEVGVAKRHGNKARELAPDDQGIKDLNKTISDIEDKVRSNARDIESAYDNLARQLRQIGF